MYIVELEGFNDGLPYREEETGFYDSEEVALAVAEVMRKKYTRVRFRVVKIIEDFRFAKETN